MNDIPKVENPKKRMKSAVVNEGCFMNVISSQKSRWVKLSAGGEVVFQRRMDKIVR